jgi:transcriptional regulator with XRE-family HTH domain
MCKLTEKVASRISWLRREKGLTQENLGAGIKRSGGHVSNIERGKAKPSISELEELATQLRVHPLHLLGLSTEACELVELLDKMSPENRTLAVELFRVVSRN